jgi:flagellin
MGSNITLTSGVRQNLLALQGTADLLSITQNRLATQKKVNSALDNPTNFFTASALTSRADALSSLLDSMSNGVSTLRTADTGLTSITGLLASMKATVSQARQDSSFNSTSYTLDTVTIGTSLLKNISFTGGSVGTIQSVALNTVGTNGTKASQDFAGVYAAPAAAAKAIYVGNGAYTSGAGAATIEITYTPTSAAGATAAISMQVAVQNAGNTVTTEDEVITAINAAILLDANFNGKIKATMNAGAIQLETLSNVDAGLTVTGTTAVFGAAFSTTAGSDGQNQFTVNGTTVTLTSGDSASLAAAINAANVQLLSAGSLFEAYENTGTTRFGIREKTAQGTVLTIGGANGTAGVGQLFAAGVAGTAATNGTVKSVDTLVTDINAHVSLAGKVKASNDAGKLRIQNVSITNLTVTGANTTDVTGNGAHTNTVIGNTTRANLVTQFNQLRDQLDKTADDSSFNGINLLKGDTLKLVFNELASSVLNIVSTAGTGINNTVLGIGTGTNATFESNSLLDALSTVLTTATSTVASQSSAFGSNLTLVNIRQDFTKNLINTLTIGAGNLTLADTNEEGANMLALQTRQQLSITALSLASQSNQAVLRLFG